MHGVVTLAGDGSRMLPWARGVRKEFLPLFDRPSATHGEPVLKPVTHLVVEALAAARVRDIVLVVRPENQTFVEGYFTIDRSLLRRHADQPERLRETQRFYQTLGHLSFQTALQPSPMGFGDAVLRAGPLLGREPFVVHAGDAVIVERERGAILRSMITLRDREELDAVLLVRRVQDPRRYGVIEGRPLPRVDGVQRLRVDRMKEKPERPRSKWAATAVYVFGPAILTQLRRRARTHPRELELTDGIVDLLMGGANVQALVLSAGVGLWRSVGSPDRYVHALLQTRALASRASSALGSPNGRRWARPRRTG
jgi:dTDP-glucose pyrophosphorylase